MKTFLFILCLSLASSAALIGADKAAPPVEGQPASTAFSGRVVETMNAASYTYLLVDTGAKKLWTAALQFEVKVGDLVSVTQALPMPNYHSKSLKRDFDLVYFTGSVAVGGNAPGAGTPRLGLPKDHPPIGSAAARTALDFTGIKKPEGGKTVEEIVTGKTGLRGQEVKVRGRVVKYNEMVMGKNWLHIRDGSGGDGSNDLTVTTATPVKRGDTVLVVGKVSTDRDFGGGYQYSVIIEDAKVTVD